MLMKRNAEAIQAFQKALEKSFFYAPSHYALGILCGEAGYPVQGMLSLMTFVVLKPESEKAPKALVLLEEMVTDEKKLAEPAQSVGITDAFPEITRLVRARLALQGQYEFKTDMRYKAVKQVQLLFEKLPANPPPTDFWGRTYAPVYRKLWEQGLFEPFTYYLMAPIDDKAAQKYKKDDKEMRRFREWASAELSELNTSKRFPLHGKERVCHHAYYKDGRLRFVVQQYDAKKTTGSGDFESYHPSGALRAKGTYTADGKKTGEWRLYFDTDELDEIQRFTTPDEAFTYQAFYPNGNLKEEGGHAGGKRTGKLVGYSPDGAKLYEGTYQQGEKHGRFLTFYPDQTLKSEANYVNGQQDGPYRNYHPNAKVSEEGSYQGGKEHGTYAAYHQNGKPSAKGRMAAGEFDGEWQWFHNNGKVAKTASFHGGKQEGVCKQFFADGTLYQEYNCVNGETDGLVRVYDTDGKLYFEQEHKAGQLRKYRYFDKQGKVVGEASARGNKLRWVAHFPSGTMRQEGEMVNGKLEGKVRQFHEAGYLEGEGTYRAGAREGLAKEYYPDGTVSEQQEYKQGQPEGLYRRFHENGQVASEGWMAGGSRQGEWRTYYANGQPDEKTYYLNDEPEGYQEYYHPDGRKYLEIFYQAGLIGQHVQYDTLGKVLHRVNIQKGNGPAEWKHLNGKPMKRFAYRFGQRDGEETLFYPTGKIQARYHYRYHALHGTSETFHPNGKPESQALYHLGRLDSTFRRYDDKGRLEFTTCYRNGNIDGTMKWLHPSGKTETEGVKKDDEREGYFTYYAEDGTPQVRIFYVRGLARGYSYQNSPGQWAADVELPGGCGKIKAFYPNGKVSFEGEMVRGKRVGVQRYYHPNGQVAVEETLVNGTRHGEAKEYYANGRPRKMETHFYDNKQGICREYREDGTLARETPYLMDLRHGTEREFDAAGKVTAKRKYVYDEPYE
jgi:antitoxin component YwqK of YwqJK toxin-antitoxin module